MKEVDITPIQHCNHPNCDMGQLEYDCPICGEFVLTCEGWYKYHEHEEFNLDCSKHKNIITYNNEKHKWHI